MTTREALAMIVLALLAAALGGMVLSDLWSWFVVPLGVRPIGIAAGCGIGMTVRLLTLSIRRSDTVTFPEYFELWSTLVAYNLIAQLVGWLLHLVGG
jgi:hypothetical protein